MVILEEQIYIYDISNMKVLHTIETSPNPQGECNVHARMAGILTYVPTAICTLSPSSENSYLAYPSPLPQSSSPYSHSVPSAAPVSASHSTSPGDVILFDALSLSVINIIQAHKAPLACLTLNSTGTLLATASDKGTVIRVFSVPNGDKVAQFRRGTYGARIFSIAFNPVSSLLAVSSDTETVHIFKLLSEAERNAAGGSGSISVQSRAEQARRAAHAAAYDDDEDNESTASRFSSPGNKSGGSYDAFIDNKRSGGKSVTSTFRKKSFAVGKSLAGSIGGFLPGTVTELWDPQRDFAFLKLPNSGVKSTVALSGTTPQIMVLTSEGIYYCYNIDLENGGECLLQKSYSLLDSSGDDGSAMSTE